MLLNYAQHIISTPKLSRKQYETIKLILVRRMCHIMHDSDRFEVALDSALRDIKLIRE